MSQSYRSPELSRRTPSGACFHVSDDNKVQVSFACVPIDKEVAMGLVDINLQEKEYRQWRELDDTTLSSSSEYESDDDEVGTPTRQPEEVNMEGFSQAINQWKDGFFSQMPPTSENAIKDFGEQQSTRKHMQEFHLSKALENQRKQSPISNFLGI